ncbi:chorismate synthase, partial [Enterococcus faecalis]|nr:chorismate synthase [Enterococcus faecalis]NSN53173.1 chorismate synthase [Enterococcus faecalis]
TAVPAASVVCEAVVATEVAKAMLEKFDSDSFEQMKEAVKRYRLYTQNF